MSTRTKRTAVPPVEDVVLAPTSRHAPRRRRQPIRPDEAFSAGFYGGLGFWLAGLFLWVVGAVVGGIAIVAMGGLGAILG